MNSFAPLFRIGAAALCAGVIAFPAVATAADPVKDYPTKPVRFIAPFVPGAGTDTTARSIAQKLSDMWGQQVVVDNRTGAAGARSDRQPVGVRARRPRTLPACGDADGYRAALRLDRLRGWNELKRARAGTRRRRCGR